MIEDCNRFSLNANKKNYIRSMEKVLKITTLKSNHSDFAFWSTKSMKERLETVEMLRQQYFMLKKDVQPRLQRVCRIINQASPIAPTKNEVQRS
jgi:hypothetical protein